MLPEIDPVSFMSAVRPLLERQDIHGLVSLLQSRWSCDQISEMLASCNDEDARKVAALCLALVGKSCAIDHLVEQLKDTDPVTNQMAEHALWSIWFRCGTPQANHELCRGTKAMNARDFTGAMQHFERAIELDPEFAEPYNQRAIAHFLQDQFEESIKDCQHSVALMPCHFGALAGMGHCYLHSGRLQQARECYERALRVNPHLECLRQSISEIGNRLGNENGD